MPYLKRIILAGLAIVFLGNPQTGNSEVSAREQWLLVLRSVSAPARTWSTVVKSGSRIRLEFIHSWDRIPIKETLMITHQGAFLLKETEFAELAVGYDSPPVSGNYRLENGKVHITDMDVLLKTIQLRIGTVANHRLWVNGTYLDLAQIFSKGHSISLRLLPPESVTSK
jgi:hypothetical protein